jgi:hypothetical protein
MKHLRHPSRSMVNIEVQTSDGSWTVIHSGTPNSPQMIQNEFEHAVSSPSCAEGKVRAVNQKTGEVIDQN